MMLTCPNSTPILKKMKDEIMEDFSIPAFNNAEAKPIPCIKPNRKIKSNRLGPKRFVKMFSNEVTKIEKAISGSTIIGLGKRIPSAVKTRVMLCASVKTVH